MHPGEKADPNSEIGKQPPEKGEAESESAGVKAQGSETDGETPTEEPERVKENDDFSALSKQQLTEKSKKTKNQKKKVTGREQSKHLRARKQNVMSC